MHCRTLTLFLWNFLIASAVIAGEEPQAGIDIAVDGGAAGGEGVVQIMPESIESDPLSVRDTDNSGGLQTSKPGTDALNAGGAIDTATRQQILFSMGLDKLSAGAAAKQCISTIVNTTLIETDESFRRVKYASHDTVTEQTRTPL